MVQSHCEGSKFSYWWLISRVSAKRKSEWCQQLDELSQLCLNLYLAIIWDTKANLQVFYANVMFIYI